MASLAAAYMSTISTHLNWGASYMVNDFYRRFLSRERREALVIVGRVTTVVLMVVAALVALWLQNALQAFQILLQIGAGTGLIFILRWFWWRINAWSEIAAMVVSFLVAVYFQFRHARLGFAPLLRCRSWSSAWWSPPWAGSRTFLTRPTDGPSFSPTTTGSARPGGWSRAVDTGGVLGSGGVTGAFLPGSSAASPSTRHCSPPGHLLYGRLEIGLALRGRRDRLRLRLEAGHSQGGLTGPGAVQRCWRLSRSDIRIVVARVDAAIAVPVAILAAACRTRRLDGDHGGVSPGTDDVNIDIRFPSGTSTSWGVAPPVAPPARLDDLGPAPTTAPRGDGRQSCGHRRHAMRRQARDRHRKNCHEE